MFKYKCFIRKNNDFLRETLTKLGYVQVSPTDKEIIIATNDGHGTSYFTTIGEESVDNLGDMFIDCHRSETLFLAIAAITDEHDKFQFFTVLEDRTWYNWGACCQKGSLEFCMVTDRYFGENPLIDVFTVPAEKSSVEYLIANFKDKEEDTDFYSKIPTERWKKDVLDFEYYPLTDEEKEELKDTIEKKKNVICKFSSASSED